MKSKNIEIEQKFKCRGPARIRAKLKAAGAKKVASGMEINDLYDKKNELARQKTILRLRKHSKQEATLTVKGPKIKDRFTKRFEAETAVNFKEMAEVLRALGYKKVRSYVKSRELYEVQGAHITLDCIGKFGWFCEIEGSSQKISLWMKKLGLTSKDREERSYLEMLFQWKS